MSESTTRNAVNQARHLLAAAGRKRNFIELTSGNLRLNEAEAATVTYQVQAAQAHALLAVVEELAGLRADLRAMTQVAFKAGADVVAVGTRLGELTEAVEHGALAVSQALDDSAAHITSEISAELSALALDDAEARPWWSRLFRSRAERAEAVKL